MTKKDLDWVKCRLFGFDHFEDEHGIEASIRKIYAEVSADAAIHGGGLLLELTVSRLKIESCENRLLTLEKRVRLVEGEIL